MQLAKPLMMLVLVPVLPRIRMFLLHSTTYAPVTLALVRPGVTVMVLAAMPPVSIVRSSESLPASTSQIYTGSPAAQMSPMTFVSTDSSVWPIASAPDSLT